MDTQQVWEENASLEISTLPSQPQELRARNLIGRLVLPFAYNYSIEDAPKTDWMKRALEGSGPYALDIGVRTGMSAKFLQHQGKRVFGIDIAQDYVDHCISAGVIENGAVCNIENTEIPGGPYDVVLLSEVIEHVLDGGDVLKRIARAMNPGGRLLITTPNLGFVENRLRLLFGRDLTSLTMDRGEVGNQHIRVFTARLLKRLCAHAGLDADMVGSDGIPVSVARLISSGESYPSIVSIPVPPTFGRTIYVRAVKPAETEPLP